MLLAVLIHVDITIIHATLGAGGGVVSEEGLDSHTGTKSLVPQLTPSKTDAKDHPSEKQSLEKVSHGAW